MPSFRAGLALWLSVFTTLTVIGIGIGSSPAQAATCVTRTMLLDVENVGSYGVAHDPKAFVTYNVQCNGNRARVTEMSYQLYVSPADCGNDGEQNALRQYRLNIDMIAGWDPVLQEWNCTRTRGSYITFRTAPVDMFVQPADSETRRCTTAHFVIDVVGDFDVQRDSPKRCINFAV